MNRVAENCTLYTGCTKICNQTSVRIDLRTLVRIRTNVLEQ